MNNKGFRNGLSLGILAFLIGGPVLAAVLFVLMELIGKSTVLAKWDFTATLVLLLILPVFFWKKGRGNFIGGYYAGLASCLLIVYAVTRTLVSVLT